MAALDDHQLAMLKRVLERDFVPHLPPLLDPTKAAEEQAKKNLSRALSAFALSKLLELPPSTAAAAVIDDFEDCGIDAVHHGGGTLYLVQGKLKAGQQVKQAEAQKFVTGVKKLVRPELGDFNQHVARRAVEITEAATHARRLRGGFG